MGTSGSGSDQIENASKSVQPTFGHTVLFIENQQIKFCICCVEKNGPLLEYMVEKGFYYQIPIIKVGSESGKKGLDPITQPTFVNLLTFQI
jgi:hypothetical protein